MVTNRCGEKVLGTRSWPYGEEIGVGAGTPQATSERLRFTGHERDFGLGDRTGDDLDYLHARSYAPTLARFLSVDPGRDVDPTVPQSLNTYTYARGNPLKYFDPDGKAVVPAAALGAMIGGVMGLAGSVLAQAYVADWDFSSINWRDARAAAAGGAISGSLFGATMGLSALAGAGVGTAAVVGAGTNLVGNAASRELDSDPATSALSSRDIAWDALSGAAGGALGSRIQQGIRAALPQVELQIASSTPAARFGNYGASQAVKGHIAKAHSLNLQAEISGSIVGAKTTNVVTPVVRVHLVERENREFSLFSSATPQ
ncbi:MAG: RHS repeat-associated core domain-containing protein [Acidobacteriota bacterium]